MIHDKVRFELHEISSPDRYSDKEDNGIIKDICYNCYRKMFISNKDKEFIMAPPRIVQGMGM